jgi:hypothetical protein
MSYGTKSGRGFGGSLRIFDDVYRDHTGPAQSSESSFSFLNRSARPYAENVRQLLERWFGEYNRAAEALSSRHLLTRLRGSDDRHFMAAFFELYCFAFFNAQGFECKPEPQTEEPTYDFTVERDGKPAFSLECVSVSGVSDKETTSNQRVASIQDTLNRRIVSSDFFLIVKIAEGPGQTPSIAGLCPRIDDWLSGLDPDVVAVEYEEREEINPKRGHISRQLEEALPSIEVEINGWEFLFIAVPRESNATGAVRPVGSVIRLYGETKSMVRCLDCKKPLRRALAEKARKYGTLDTPFVIALNATDAFADDLDIKDTLVGARGIHEYNDKGEVELTEVQLASFWFDHGKPTHARVSGVLTSIQLHPFSVARQTPILWCNPWASYRVDSVSWRGPRNILVPQNDKTDPLRINTISGETAYEILGLDPNWPLQS